MVYCRAFRSMYFSFLLLSLSHVHLRMLAEINWKPIVFASFLFLHMDLSSDFRFAFTHVYSAMCIIPNTNWLDHGLAN